VERNRRLNWLLIFAIIASIVVVVILIMNFAVKSLIQIIGLLSGIWGAFLLATDYTDEMFSNVGYYGSAKPVAELLEKQTKRRKLGIFLLILGFLIQGIGKFV